MSLRKKILRIKKFKSGRKLVCLTAYSKPFSKILDKYCDIILVGDSVATAFYGMKNTKSITLSTMISHGISVKKMNKKSTLVFDMPINTYRNLKEAKKNARKVINTVGCDAVKIESNGRNFRVIKGLVESGIPVMGHIGYTPQNKNKFKPQGTNLKETKKLIFEAKKIEKAGAFSIVLECIARNAAKQITSLIKIPTIGIGSSNFCDGQILVTDDLIGLSGFYPKFVKKYLDLEKILGKSIKKFRDDVRVGNFPKLNNTY
jgi:3-methyl-2-oxobutanoate hydroxymethyltransferase